MGALEEIMHQNQIIIEQNKQLLRKAEDSKSVVKVKDTSWIDIPFICEDLKIAESEFHAYWKDKMPFLFKAKGKGSKLKGVRWKYEAWKEEYMDKVRSGQFDDAPKTKYKKN